MEGNMKVDMDVDMKEDMEGELTEELVWVRNSPGWFQLSAEVKAEYLTLQGRPQQGLDGQEFHLFSVNDSAANMVLGIKMSEFLKEYTCDIHKLELVIKDALKKKPGMDWGWRGWWWWHWYWINQHYLLLIHSYLFI